MTSLVFTPGLCYDIDKIVRSITKTHKRVIVDYKILDKHEIFETFQLAKSIDDIKDDINGCIDDYGEARRLMRGGNVLTLGFGDQRIYEIWGLTTAEIDNIMEFLNKANKLS